MAGAFFLSASFAAAFSSSDMRRPKSEFILSSREPPEGRVGDGLVAGEADDGPVDGAGAVAVGLGAGAGMTGIGAIGGT